MRLQLKKHLCVALQSQSRHADAKTLTLFDVPASIKPGDRVKEVAAQE
jgi:hypothetical protein